MQDSSSYRDLQTKFYDECARFPMVSSQHVLKACLHPLYQSEERSTYVLKLDRLSLPKGTKLVQLQAKPAELPRHGYSINEDDIGDDEEQKKGPVLSLGQ